MKMISRYLENEIMEAMAYMPVVTISGARQVGKSTLATLIAGDIMEYVTLDDDGQLDAAISDPIGFIQNHSLPLVIDEIQRAPNLLRTIKRVVDKNQKAGQFLLTGSANLLTLPSIADSLAGRMKVTELYSLAQFELSGKEPTFLSRAFSDKPQFEFSDIEQDQLIAKVLTGGYPSVIELSEPRRTGWHNAYVRSIVDRDIKDVVQVHKFFELSRLIRILAILAGNEIIPTVVAEKVQLDRKTVSKYIFALEQVYLLKRVPAWHRNELKRIVKKPKLHFLDSGLLASLQKVTTTKLENDRTPLGPLLETFIFSELLKISQNTFIDSTQESYEIYHYRDTQKNEVDFVIENTDSEAIGIEVKASQTASLAQFKGLKALANYTKLKAGFVIYTGKDFLSFGDNMYAVPLQALFV
jgi:predicted AAA+ superfamily ATPase